MSCEEASGLWRTADEANEECLQLELGTACGKLVSLIESSQLALSIIHANYTCSSGVVRENSWKNQEDYTANEATATMAILDAGDSDILSSTTQ